jgi:osmoprotectant transport system ATP-binding protein
MLELRGVSKRYGDSVALHTTDLAIRAGQTTALLGPSGCGKSTLLRVMVGLIPATTGEVIFDGNVITPQNARKLRQRMGYVIQEGGLFPHMTARQNATIMARHLGWDRERMEARLVELARLVDLPLEWLERYPAQLSGGQRQRVSMMRALFLDPALILLDEPMGALDPLIRSELQAQLREIFRTLRKTVIMVTHDIGEAGFLADTIMLLKSGRIVQQGTLVELVRSPADPFVTQFINAQRSPLESIA